MHIIEIYVTTHFSFVIVNPHVSRHSNVYAKQKAAIAPCIVGASQRWGCVKIGLKGQKGVLYNYSLLCLSKTTATVLLLVKSCLLCNFCHSTNVSLFKYIDSGVVVFPSSAVLARPS